MSPAPFCHISSNKSMDIFRAFPSVLGFMGIYGYTAYAASKFAITGFVDCLRQEMLPHNVTVSVLFPPDTDTPQFHEENRIKPPETKAIAGNIKVMSPDAVAGALLEGIEKQQYHIVPGISSKFTYFMYRHFPSVGALGHRRRSKKVPKEKPPNPTLRLKPQLRGKGVQGSGLLCL